MLGGQMSNGITFSGAIRHRHNQGNTYRYGLPGNGEKKKFTILIVLN